MFFYPHLKELRKSKNLSQNDIGKQLGITPQQYQLYESGKREILFHLAVKLAEFYDVSLDYIAGRTNDKKGMYIPELSPEENQIINKYRMLDEKNKGKLIERLDMLNNEE